MRSFTDPPGLKNSALAYTGVRIPCVTRFSRTSGVQPMVSRILPYGLAWDGIRVRFRRAVRDGARRVLALRDGVPFRRRRVTPRRADRSHRRGDRDRKSTRLNSSHDQKSYAVFCLKKKKKHDISLQPIDMLR